MEQKDIDIYEILKGMPDGTPLYTSMCGNVEFTSVEADKEKSRAIWTENKNGAYSFDKHGKWMKGGEALLFPSKEMRDWSKFFKKGDVLEYVGDEKLQGTCTFGNQYEIETEKFVTDQAFDLRISMHDELREATENEVELFEKHYSIWTEKEKEVREQPAFKTFDKVLVRDSDTEEWEPAIFLRMSKEEEKKELPYQVFSLYYGFSYETAQCIPYEGSEHLAFTSDPF
jgi:hypothetical protein